MPPLPSRTRRTPSSSTSLLPWKGSVISRSRLGDLARGVGGQELLLPLWHWPLNITPWPPSCHWVEGSSLASINPSHGHWTTLSHFRWNLTWPSTHLVPPQVHSLKTDGPWSTYTCTFIWTLLIWPSIVRLNHLVTFQVHCLITVRPYIHQLPSLPGHLLPPPQTGSDCPYLGGLSSSDPPTAPPPPTASPSPPPPVLPPQSPA